jgi:protein TonB
VVAPPAPTSAARENIAAQAQTAKADWQARVLGHLRQYRRYPRAAESAAQQGIATLAITLDRQGRVLEVALRHGSGYALLDAEALATARRASPCPRPMRRCPATRCGSRCPSTFPCAGGG